MLQYIEKELKGADKKAYRTFRLVKGQEMEIKQEPENEDKFLLSQVIQRLNQKRKDDEKFVIKLGGCMDFIEDTVCESIFRNQLEKNHLNRGFDPASESLSLMEQSQNNLHIEITIIF